MLLSIHLWDVVPYVLLSMHVMRCGEGVWCHICCIDWMDGVNVALGNRGMTVEAARQCAKDRKEWSPEYICNWMTFTRSFLLGPVFFRTALPCSGDHHLERKGMSLHDTVGINYKKGSNYWKSRCRCQVYGLRGIHMFDHCVCVIWIDITTPPWWKEKVVVYFTIFQLWFFIMC